MIRVALGFFGPNHFLAGGGIALGAVAVWPWIVSPAPPRPLAPSQNQPMKSSAVFALPPLTAFGAIAERPLFSSSRRPVHPEGPIGAATGLESRYRLIGLITTESTRRAWLAEGARHFDVGEGDTLDGWKIVRVERDRLLLSSSTGQTALTLKRAANDDKTSK